MLRIRLYSEGFGEYLIDDVDPDGLNNFEIELKRSKDADGIFYEFSIDLDFNKGARSFIKNVYDALGVDGEIKVDLFEYGANNYRFVREYTGQLRLLNLDLTETTISCNVEQIGFQRKFLNFEELDVDIASTESKNGIALENKLITIPLAPKTIKKKAFISTEIGSNEFIESGFFGASNGFLNSIRICGDNAESDFENAFLNRDSWGLGYDALGGSGDFRLSENLIIKADEAGDYLFDMSNLEFDIRIDVDDVISPNLTSLHVRCYFSILNGNSQTPYPSPLILYDETFTQLDFDSVTNPEPLKARFETYNQSLNTNTITSTLELGQEVYFWFDYAIDFEGAGDSNRNVGFRLSPNKRFELTGDTVFPETQCEGVMAHEFFEKIVQYYTDSQVAFKSDFFGRTDLGYDEDGIGSLLFFTNGGKIRGLERLLFANWKDAFKSVESIFCLGWGFEEINGQQIVRLEPKSYFYNNSIVSVDLGNVSGLRKQVIREEYYQNVMIGYPKIEDINQINGVDEFNSKRTFNSPVEQSKGTLDLVSKYRASGFEIERQRRLSVKTDESRLDDENFIIVVKRSGGSFVVEQGDVFESITGVFDPDTAYNVRISPARMIDNWKEILAASCVKKINPSWKFSSGTNNYEMTSKLLNEEAISERGDVVLGTIKPLYLLEKYPFEAKTIRDQRNLIRDNPNAVIQFLDWGNNKCYGFLENVKFQVENNKGVYMLRRANPA